MPEKDRHAAIPITPESLKRLQELWKTSESGHLGFNPTIDPGLELDYYAGSTLVTMRLRVGILRYYLAPTVKPDELSRQMVAELEWLERDLDIVGESLRIMLELTQPRKDPV